MSSWGPGLCLLWTAASTLALACGGDDGSDSLYGGDGDTNGDGDGDGDGSGDGDGDGDGSGDGDGDGDGGPLLDVGGGDGDGDGDDPGDGCERIDLVFVMDISASMMEEKENLQDHFDDFIAVLDAHLEENPEFTGYRIGVTNSSINMDFGGCETTMGMDGSLHDGDTWNGDCGYGPDPWMEGPSAQVAAQFACVADNPIPPGGGSDCGHEMPLHAIQAFGPKLAAGEDNEGFYDPNGDALLVFVVITDEDEDAEWTQTNPAETKAYLDELAGGEERYGVVVIAGPGPGSCEGNYGDAIEAVTLREFAELVPNGVFGSICTGDLHETLHEGLEQMVVSCDELPPPTG